MTEGERIVQRIKDLYAKGMMDKLKVKRVVRASSSMTDDEFDDYHAEALEQILEITNLSKEQKRARALMRLSFIQSKLLEDDNLNMRSLLEVERLRMSVEGTEAPKEIHQTVSNESIVATTKEDADRFFLDMGVINMQFSEDDVHKLLEEPKSEEGDLVVVDVELFQHKDS